MNSHRFNIEVLMAAYNNAPTMRVVLEGYLRQTDTNFSIAIADDGSGPEVAALAREFADRGLTIRHLWQEDRGFRKAIALNKAIATSSAEYLVFTDNDCVPQKNFIADHRRAARPGCFVAGRRVDLGPELTRQVKTGVVPLSLLENRGWLLRNAVNRKLRHAEYGLGLPWTATDLWSRKQVGLLGANMAIWKSDVLLINGFDGGIPGGDGEEVDLEWRLMAAGVDRTSLLGRASVVHLYHTPRPNEDPTGRQYRLDKMARNEFRAAHGIE